LIADAVSAPPDGKFYIHGGGLTRLTVPHFPFPVPQLGVFVRLEVDKDEVGGVHDFRFALSDPDGSPVAAMPPFRAELPALPPGAPEPEEGEQRFVVLAVNLAGILVGRAGLHTLAFYVDEDRLGEIPLPVVPLTPDQLQGMVGALNLPTPRSSPGATSAKRRQPPRRR
jgi:hypothetical protein